MTRLGACPAAAAQPHRFLASWRRTSAAVRACHQPREASAVGVLCALTAASGRS